MIKQQFITLMQALYDQHQKSLQLAQFGKLLFPNDYISYPEDSFVVTIQKYITNAMNDVDGWVDYYIHDLDWGTNKELEVKKKGKKVKLETFDDLYDFIIS